MKNDGLRLIAIGIALTTQERKRKIELLNDRINDELSGVRSPVFDGMPRGGGLPDPTSARAQTVEEIADERDREQHLVNAVAWAEVYIRELYAAEDVSKILRAISLDLHRQREAAKGVLAETRISWNDFSRHIKPEYLRQIIKYIGISRM